MNDLISVIVPVYNVALYVEKCIRSIINQSYNNLEIIVVNDGSTDNSLEIIKRLEEEDNRIILIDKLNGGSASAKNAGMMEAKGDYYLFIDSDDYIDEQAIEILYTNAIKHDADISIMRVAQVYSDGHKEEFLFGKGECEVLDLTHPGWFFEDASVFHPVWNKLYKRNLIDFLFDEKLKRNEDIAFNGKAYCKAKKIVIYNKPLYFQLQRSSSLCHAGRRTDEEIELVKRVYDEVLNYIEQTKCDSERKAEIVKYLHFRIDILLQMIIYDGSGYKKRREYMRRLRHYFPGWKFSLMHKIKSPEKDNKSILIKGFYRLHLYFLIYHFIDIGAIIRKLRMGQNPVNSRTELYK